MAEGRATLVFMFRSLLHRVQLIRYTIAVNSWLVRLRYWWFTRETEQLIFLSILGLIPVVLLFAIWQSVEFQHKSIETQQKSIQAQQQNRELHCLALNVYHEARGEPTIGQYAVAEVTMNRVASKRYPDTVCEVVYEKRWDRIRKRHVGAFSWTELDFVSTSDVKAWERAKEVAERVFYGREEPRVNGALFYHARRIRPSWARKKVQVARIGRHIFYR